MMACVSHINYSSQTHLENGWHKPSTEKKNVSKSLDSVGWGFAFENWCLHKK